MEFVFEIDAAKQNELKKVLELDPYADDAFSRLGYTLKDSSALGLPAGKVVLHFKCEDAALAQKYAARVKPVEGIKEATPEVKAKVIETLQKEADEAASGFGSIFG